MWLGGWGLGGWGVFGFSVLVYLRGDVGTLILVGLLLVALSHRRIVSRLTLRGFAMEARDQPASFSE